MYRGNFSQISATVAWFDFYTSGAVKNPAVSTLHIDKFIENDIPELWAYYCVSEDRDKLSNRFIAMPSFRNRILGTQMYKYNIKGFLHWGFNFYNSRYSVKPIDPYQETCGEYFTPAGDCFLVYPAQDGTAYSSLHCQQFYMALEDHKAMMLCESLVGREKTLAAVEEGTESFTGYGIIVYSATGLLSKLKSMSSFVSLTMSPV